MFLSLQRRCLDLLTLRPSRHRLDCGSQRLLKLNCDGQRLEIFRQIKAAGSIAANPPIQDPDSPQSGVVDLLIIKWPGNGGRAENSTVHPAMAWPKKTIELWTVNPLGYGHSQGQASLANIHLMAKTVWHAARQRFPDTPILLFGTSIGCATAIYQARLSQQSSDFLNLDNDSLSSNRLPAAGDYLPAAGLFLRNPPPLPSLIGQHYHRWFYGPFTQWICNSLPSSTDSVALARQCTAPMFMLQAEMDSIVPAVFQDQIFDAYQGVKQKFVLQAADHDQLPSTQPGSPYLNALHDFFSPIL